MELVNHNTGDVLQRRRAKNVSRYRVINVLRNNDLALPARSLFFYIIVISLRCTFVITSRAILRIRASRHPFFAALPIKKLSHKTQIILPNLLTSAQMTYENAKNTILSIKGAKNGKRLNQNRRHRKVQHC